MRAARRWIAGLVAAASLAAVPVAAASAAPVAPVVSGDLHPELLFHPMTAERVLDTRAGAPVGPQEKVEVDLGDHVPVTAAAVVLNLTATDVTATGFLRVGGGATSSLNTRVGDTRAGSVTVAIHPQRNPAVSVFNSAGTADVIVDLLGWYEPAGNEGLAAYYPLGAGSQRIADTRRVGGALANGGVVDVGADIALAGVVAVAVNVTAVGATGSGYLRAWDGATEIPEVSTVNFRAATSTPNFTILPVTASACTVIAPPCTHIAFAVQNVGSSSTQVLVDLQGVYATDRQAGATVFGPAPSREIDTRRPGSAPLTAGRSYRLSVAHPSPGVEDRSVAVNATVIAIRPTAATYLTAFPFGSARPVASDLNVPAGDVRSNSAQVVLDAKATNIALYDQAGTVDVVVDISGRFYREERAAPGAGPAVSHVVVADRR